jgi:hypothetical protein
MANAKHLFGNCIIAPLPLRNDTLIVVNVAHLIAIVSGILCRSRFSCLFRIITMDI